MKLIRDRKYLKNQISLLKKDNEDLVKKVTTLESCHNLDMIQIKALLDENSSLRKSNKFLTKKSTNEQLCD